MKKIYNIISLAILSTFFLLLTSCSKDDFFDLFIGKQPKFIEEESFQKKLNIFGVLRPDSTTQFPNNLINPHDTDFNARSMSYINVDRTIMTINDTISDSIPLPDADVKLYKIVKKQITDTLIFNFTDHNNYYARERYRNVNFFPAAGETYRFICYKQGYDTVVSETVIPNRPEISGNIDKKANSISFTLNISELFSEKIIPFTFMMHLSSRKIIPKC